PLPLLARHRPRDGSSFPATHAEPRRATDDGWGARILPTDASDFLRFEPAARSPRQALHLAPTGNSNCRRPARVVDVDQLVAPLHVVPAPDDCAPLPVEQPARQLRPALLHRRPSPFDGLAR